MHPAVENIWIPFNEKLEGVVPYLYADVKNLITIGMGNLVDPVSSAVRLPLRLQDGTLATRVQIIAAWNAVKNDPLCATKGHTYAYKLLANGLHLDPEDVKKLIFSKLKQHDAVFAKRFSAWESRPADAQLAVHSMGWAMGSDFPRKFPRFSKLFEAGAYEAAIVECEIADAEGTVIERNRRTKVLLANAACHGYDPSILRWEC